MVYIGMLLSKYVAMTIVDVVTTFIGKLWYGDLTKYGIRRPTKGPFQLKAATGKTPVIDIGTVKKIQSGDIKVEATYNSDYLSMFISVNHAKLKYLLIIYVLTLIITVALIFLIFQ